ncbi:unnamed protein product [Absidia cylindrospora]
MSHSKVEGFNMHQDIHEVLSLSHIVLLNENQHGKALVESVGLNNLELYLTELKTRYVVDGVLSDALFQKLATMFRNLDTKFRTAKKIGMVFTFENTQRSILFKSTNQKKKISKLRQTGQTDRQTDGHDGTIRRSFHTPYRTLKMELMALALEPDNDDLDLHILDVLMNCVRRLPEYNIDEPIGEQDFIMNYVDPILSPIFHHPDNGCVLHWLNRTTEDTETLRPDGCIYLTQQQNMRYAIGYCEVKARDAEDNVDSIHNDLFRLASFCKIPLIKVIFRALMAIQVVGETLIFYLFSLESAGHYVMFEIGRLDAPLTFGNLPQFIMKLDFLKKLSATYIANCIERTESNSSTVGFK